MKAKQRIRKITVTAILLIVIGASGSAQGMPVYDNTNFIILGKQILESAKQTAELLKTVKFLKEQKDNIVKVNNVVKQLKAAREIGRNNERLFQMVRRDLRNILDSPFIRPGEVRRISDSFNAIMGNALDDFELVSQVLASGSLKMTDAERARILGERERRSKEMVVEIERKTRRYAEIIEFREMQRKINERRTSY